MSRALDAPPRMTVDEFISWCETQPKGRYELHDGVVVSMSPERLRHTEIKFEAAVALRQAIRKAGLQCWLLADGATVRIDDTTAYEPDALVYCGPKLSGDATEVPEPVIVVEVLSPSTQANDQGNKLADYFRVPSVQHYLIIDPARPLVVHHARQNDGSLRTTFHREGEIRLDPPGLMVGVGEVYQQP